MEQSIVTINSPPTITDTSITTSVSLNDSTYDRHSTNDIESPVAVVIPSDDTMDLLRAIEMSRWQAERENEQNIYRPNLNNNTKCSTLSKTAKFNYFNDLQEAIELSLKTKNEDQLPCEETSLLSAIFTSVSVY